MKISAASLFGCFELFKSKTRDNIAHLPPAFSGRKILYTDFDNTYFPFVRSDISASNSEAFRNMYLPFIKFRKSQGNDFELNITTGRSANDYLHTQERINQSGLTYCFPDGLVSSNGANVFKFKNGVPVSIFPIEDRKAQGVIDDIIKLISETDDDIEIVECKINGDKKTYQQYSSEYELDKLNPEKYISIARDGRYNAEIVISKNIDFDNIRSLIEQHIKENNLPFSIEHYKNDIWKQGFEYTKDGKQEVKADVIFLKYSPCGAQPDKFDIVKQEVQEIQESGSDDFVITAGDAYNDEKMLNPLNYIDGDKNIENPDTISKLAALPFRAIICGNDNKLDNLRVLGEKLKEKGIEIIKTAPNNETDFIRAVNEFCIENDKKGK